MEAPESIDQRVIAHIDLDAFYASVEQLDHPELRGKPVIVGGLGPRGVVSTASYEARKFGVHSAMPMAQARRLCPQAGYLPPRMSRYRVASRQIFAIFHRYTPLVEGLSLDEAFLDLSASLRLFGAAAAIAKRIREDILRETGLSAAVGVAPNKFLAKLGSELAKPGGIQLIEREKIRRVLDPLPVKQLWGVGPKTAARLRQSGLLTIGQIRRLSLPELQKILGQQAPNFHALAHGEDDRPVTPEQQTRSISHEETFDKDIGNREYLMAVLQAQSEKVARRLRHADLTARCVTVKLRDGRFNTITRSRTLNHPSAETRLLYYQARRLFSAWWRQEGGRPLRLLGVGVSQLQRTTKTAKGDLIAASPRLDRTLDEIHQRFGKQGVGFARGQLKNKRQVKDKNPGKN